MTGYETANYQEINAYCRSERLDTDYFLYEVKAGRRNRRRRVLRIIVSILR